VLGSIPVLGYAFKKKDKSTRNVELLVFLRPKVIRTTEDAQALLHDMDKKVPEVMMQSTNHVAPAKTNAKGKRSAK
jgi:type II secretory pathway component GspD/PulD (secretin)